MLEVKAINAFNDNYIWCIQQSSSQLCVLVDPGDGKTCIDYIEQQKLQLTDILITHHHADHIGGVDALRDYAANQGWPLTVYGPATEALHVSDIKLVEGQQVSLFQGLLPLDVVDLPGHTKGHIGYVTNQWLFCGDTLFSGGCGRLFEGTPEQMLTSLNKLKALGDHTLVFCAHEYTLANLEFARTIEPNNSQLNDYIERVIALRQQQKRTVPSTIGLEKQINPFLRSHLAQVKVGAEEKSGLHLHSDVDVFASIRHLKDRF
ncbi:hydroxyacylglutathione hydrolase [Thalassotalea ponticola]|uniref:hydroxyacylglutathione hydrolase n=1 Tax=Thalassotalea ponticola TaxID=1523392 RepID=UPI0025B629D1|nr:hydroxyacylglutathione hydrolase [Thalassotalea ponticola]MDN3651409.1 hydroxyacylglutathione hydrolase [Thalassotalea ponticola]